MKTKLKFHLLNGQKFVDLNYITDAIGDELDTDVDVEEYDLDVYLKDVSCGSASGYGTYITSVVMRINDIDMRYNLTHHNEDYKYCFRDLYNDAANSVEEKEELEAQCQAAFESVIDGYIDDIRYRITQMIEKSIEIEENEE